MCMGRARFGCFGQFIAAKARFDGLDMEAVELVTLEGEALQVLLLIQFHMQDLSRSDIRQ